MISEAVPALTRGRISHVDQNYLRPENYTAANSILIAAQDSIALTRQWGGGLVAGIDGMRFVVPVRSIHARPNPKYFGRRRGATWLNMLNDQAVGLAGRVLSGTPRDSLHMIDLIYSQDAGQRPDVIITDTGSYSDIVFALITLLGFDYRPQLADLPDAKLWRIAIGADYGPLNAAARGKIDPGRIERQWPDILRVVASIHTGGVAAYDILRVLAPGGTPTQLGDALAHYGRIFKTLHVLSYVDDEPYPLTRSAVSTRLDSGPLYDTRSPLFRPPGHLHGAMRLGGSPRSIIAADDAGAAGNTSELLGFPVAINDLYDTKDMPTTDGSLAFEGWRPKRDAFQVKKLREAGAVILGKANLSEFANSGSYSDSGYGMVWNAFKPSKTSLGSSGGSAVATALSLAGFGMGTQTGVSLYAPSTGASLVTLRGTDGISSGAGVMPLTWLQDFEGPMTRTTSDIARVLNVTTGTDPDDIATVHADADNKRPADWKTALDPNALQGKKIGYIASAFDGSPSYGQDDGTVAALKARFADIVAAGATIVEITTPTPSSPATGTLTGNRTEEGWQRYFDLHEAPPYHTASEILSSPKVLPYNRQTVPARPRLTAEDIDKIFVQRDEFKARYKAWMDAASVDAVVYPGFRSDVYDNDGAQTISSDRNSGVPTSNVGLPTLVLPVGANPHGDPMSLQFVGRAWDDAKVLGFGYALERKLGGAGHLAPATAPRLASVTEATAPVGGMVPATLALTMGAPATFGAFTPGVAKDYTATTTANVISTAGDAALSVSDPGHLLNGSFSLPEPLGVEFSKATWAGPISNDPVTVTFKQHIGATDALRTGSYSKTLTFTLSTTTP